MPAAPPPWTIRPATVDDAEAIEALRVGVWKQVYRGLLPDDYLDWLTVTPEHVGQFREALQNTTSWRFIVAEANGQLVGYGGVGPVNDYDFPPASPGAGELRTLNVAMPWQSCGVGRALLARLTDALQDLGYTGAVLWTFRDNPAARAFYEASGWTPDRHGDFDLHGPEPMSAPAVRYIRPLEGVP
jgi:GNAT superfamily N-acetyltransferase